MEVVVDTNILFSFFWEKSITKKLLTACKFRLISPKIALEEIKKYSKEIIRKTKNKRFEEDLKELKSFVNFVERKDYSEFMEEALELSPDKKDTEFFALCLQKECFLWSNDSELKKQNKIKVLSTKEIIEIFI